MAGTNKPIEASGSKIFLIHSKSLVMFYLNLSKCLCGARPFGLSQKSLVNA
jgi:hypothetical protein